MKKPMTLFSLELISYYEYLFKISWPALIGLFLIFFFLVLRLFQTFKYYRTRGFTFLNMSILLGRLVLTLAVVSIYTQLFLYYYGDWIQKPSVSRGIVASIEKSNEQSNRQYIMTLISGEESLTVKVDSGIYRYLKKEDMIEIEYLPIKKEVFRCTRLTQQVDNVI